jgi:hypothetical protein
MDDSKNAWLRVGLNFAAAGDKLKTHAKAAAEEASGSDQDQAAVVDALNALGKAMNQAANSVTSAVKDPEVRDQLSQALNSVGEALTVTFADVGDRVGDKVKDTFGRGSTDQSDAGPSDRPPSAPPPA